ncbi:MAG: SprB repeat-containing protein [Sphingobacteriales bacterium]|nr:SprB repeat-containing protein [Sphingobacteriales bacterium]
MPNVSATTVDNTNCTGIGNGSINITVSGGTLPYTFVWSNAATTEDISNLNAATYTVTVTTNNGCSV